MVESCQYDYEEACAASADHALIKINAGLSMNCVDRLKNN